MVDRDAFERLVLETLGKASDVRPLSHGRTAYWSDIAQMVVIADPSAADAGTAFRPSAGKTYFMNLRWISMISETAGTLNFDDRNTLLNVLNEILHGLSADVAGQLPTSRENLSSLHGRLAEAEGPRDLSPQEALLLLDALRLCESAVPEPEFAIRLGVSREQAERTVATLQRCAAASAPLQTHAAAS